MKAERTLPKGITHLKSRSKTSNHTVGFRVDMTVRNQRHIRCFSFNLEGGEAGALRAAEKYQQSLFSKNPLKVLHYQAESSKDSAHGFPGLYPVEVTSKGGKVWRWSANFVEGKQKRRKIFPYTEEGRTKAIRHLCEQRALSGKPPFSPELIQVALEMPARHSRAA